VATRTRTATTRRTVSDGVYVGVVGLEEFRKALRTMDKQLPRELRKANKNAAEVVASAARSRAESQGGVQAKTAPSVKAAAEARHAKVSLGGARYPFALGANFGAGHNKPRSTSRGAVLGWNQFPAWGGNQVTGGANDMFLYWAIRAKRAAFMRAYERELDQLIDRI